MTLPVPKDKISDIASKYQSLISTELLRSFAKESKFIRRQRIMTGEAFAKMCILGGEPSGKSVSLPQLSARGVELGIKMSTSSLHDRFNASSERFMQLVFEWVLHFKLSNDLGLNTLEDFSAVQVQDSTGWQLPDALKSRFPGFGGAASEGGVKIDLRMNVKRGSFEVDIRGAKQNDATASMGTISEGSLWLRDLGYFKIESLRDIQLSGAFFISRMKSSTHIYSSENSIRTIELEDLSKKLNVNQIREQWVYIGKDERFRVRLIIQKLPEQVANERKRALKASMKDKGKSLTNERLSWCEYNVFITNLGDEKYAGQLVMNLYAIRWTIEIVFKVWKSVYKIQQVNATNEHRFMCQLYGKLIWIFLNQKLFSWVKTHFWNRHHIDLSEMKGHKILQDLKASLQAAIIFNVLALFEKFIELFWNTISIVGKKQPRKRRRNQLLFPSDSLVYEAEYQGYSA